MGLNSEEPTILRAGDALYEGPDDAHTGSANASLFEPASVIAFVALAPDQPSTVFERPV